MGCGGLLGDGMVVVWVKMVRTVNCEDGVGDEGGEVGGGCGDCYDDSSSGGV